MMARPCQVSKCLCLLILITTLAACNASSSAPPTGTGPPAPTAKTTLHAPSDPEVISRLDTYFTNLGFTGSVLIARDGKILLNKGYGEADRVKKIPNTARTKFRIASVTKQFTAMAILILQSQGKLDLQDSVCAYMSTCPSAWQAITLHHLLTHTSGLPDYYSSPDWALYQATPIAPSELIDHFIDKPLDFQPGEKWNYSNSGYEVLGTIIEQVSGTTYETFIKENILLPLNMIDTGYLENTDDLSIGYPDAYTTLPASFEHPSTLFASGGLYTTVNDLYLWDQAVFTDKLIPKELSDKMLTLYISVSDMGIYTGFGYGYGWFIGEIENHRVLFHTGRIEGFTAINYVYPDDNVIVVVLSNQWTMSVNPFQLADFLFGDK